MDEFEAIARYAVHDLELPEGLREQVVKRVAVTLFWDRKLTCCYLRQRLRDLGSWLESEHEPASNYANYVVGAEISKIRREHQGSGQCQTSND